MKCIRNWWGDCGWWGGLGGWSSKLCKAAYRGREVTPHACVGTHTYTHAQACVRRHLHLFMFLAAFLSYSVLFYLQKFNLIFNRKRCVHQKRLFFSNKINFCGHKISFFYLKLFFRSKVSQNAFNFNQIETQIYSIFLYDALLSKKPCAVQRRK